MDSDRLLESYAKARLMFCILLKCSKGDEWIQTK